jgi:two-component system phosphate regulon sensor histidine kinase PhoR
MITLGAAVIGFSAVIVVSILLFMNSLYYEINAAGLEHTAKIFWTVLDKDSVKEILLNNNNADPDIHPGLSLPSGTFDTYRLTLIASSGYVMWDSHVSDRLVNHLDRKEIKAALEGKVASARRESITTGLKRIYYAMPVYDDMNIIGVFRLSIAVPGFLARISPVILPFLVFITLFVIAAFWAIFVFSRSLSASLVRLVKIAQAGSPAYSGSEASQHVTLEFDALEMSLKAMKSELNFRFEQAKSEGQRLEAILNGMSEAVFAMDSSLKLHLVNPRARELFNLGNKEIISMTLLEATRSADLAEAAKRTISGGRPLEMELAFHTDQEQHFQVFAAPLARTTSLSAGAVNYNGAVLVLQEITRLVKLERVRKDFVANVSHELRTPIQLIKGFSETLLDTISDNGDEKNKQMIHFTQIIRKNAGIMENLTNDLLILSSLENTAGYRRGSDYHIEEFSIMSLIDEAVCAMQPQAKKKQIEIIVNCPQELTAKLQGSFIIQALINLIDNGIKFSPPESELRVNAVLEGDELVLEVHDRGIGIPSEHLARIFERFYRVDHSRSREDGSSGGSNWAKHSGGTGLGLSIVRHVAALHNGKAEVESRYGEGSVFRIKIPQESSSEDSSSSDSSSASSDS